MVGYKNWLWLVKKWHPPTQTDPPTTWIATHPPSRWKKKCSSCQCLGDDSAFWLAGSGLGSGRPAMGYQAKVKKKTTKKNKRRHRRVRKRRDGIVDGPGRALWRKKNPQTPESEHLPKPPPPPNKQPPPQKNWGCQVGDRPWYTGATIILLGHTPTKKQKKKNWKMEMEQWINKKKGVRERGLVGGGGNHCRCMWSSGPPLQSPPPTHPTHPITKTNKKN